MNDEGLKPRRMDDQVIKKALSNISASISLLASSQACHMLIAPFLNLTFINSCVYVVVCFNI